ncbi:hypothetical protein [Mucilaginibacter sp. RCC_168]|uniref:hypothetical protein n=1 Tax=Mucilaginibacter sp. RCC_168 TaxID=3239221 RepID=UPI0035251849
MKEELFYNLRLKNTWKETTYTYSSDSLLIKKDIYGMDNGIKTSMGYNYYTYDDKRLINEKYWELSADKTPITVQCDYNADGLPSKMSVQKDTLYKTVQYQYLAKKTSKIHVETNATSGLSREFPILVYLGNLKKFPIKYDTEYSYDKNGNLIEWKNFLNEEPQSFYSYSLQYY